MSRERIIPVLQFSKTAAVKTRQFNEQRYLGDLLNAITIFNDKEVDELLLIDVEAPRVGHAPRIDYIARVASECFVPLSYGGGISTLAQMEALFRAGIEKVVLSSCFFSNPGLVVEAVRTFGSQAISICLDYRLSGNGLTQVRYCADSITAPETLFHYVIKAQDAGAGELVLQCINRDGTKEGYDLQTLRRASQLVDIPLVALGGAKSMSDIAAAILNAGCAAAAAGSLFHFFGRLDAVLINVPSQSERAAAIADVGQ